MIEIDGSYGEGGGQLVRTAVALSAITGKAVRISSIRGGRPNPGLKAQHLKGIEAVSRVCGAKVEGARLGSTELTFHPGEIRPDRLKIDIGTAGAVTLVLQALVLAAGKANGTTTIELTGGTHVSWSPPVDYFTEIFCSHLKRIGVVVEVEILRYGFFPKGGGHIRVVIEGAETWHPLDLEERGGVKDVSVHSIATDELRNARVAERQISGFRTAFGGEISESHSYVPSPSIGSAIFAKVAFESTSLGGDALGKKGIKAEQVGEDAARKLRADIDNGGSLDTHAADMILPYLALASGPSKFSVRELSGHLNSVEWLLRQFINVDFSTQKTGKSYVITVAPKGMRE